MRLHRLEIQAFGPFAESCTVDVDRLSAAGLFLLSGATGAGKTSVLDAVCFALYGDVPGDRSGAKRLRSDQAAPGVAPRVLLEATLSGRRFRFVRSPAWERPKRRGAGTTAEQASVVVSEKMRGEWVTLSTRLDEAGHLVGHLVGMTLTQFTQVAMLPQGRFQTFLRARSDDRHRLLQQLFRTGRFEDVERWLRDHRLDLRRRTGEAHLELADLLSRTSEATGTALPATWALPDLAEPLRAGEVTGWLGARTDEVTTSLLAAEEQVAATTEVETGLRADLVAARERAERHRRRVRARAELVALDADAGPHAERQRRLDAARRAAPLVPVVAALATAQRRLERAEAAHRGALAAAAQVAPELDLIDPTGSTTDGSTTDGSTTDGSTTDGDAEAERLALVRRRLGDAVGAARALATQEVRRDRLAAELAATEVEHAAARVAVDDLVALQQALPALLQQAEQAVAAADTADRRLLTLVPERDATLVSVTARREVAGAERQVALARTAHAEARELAQACRQLLLDAREARLETMAAEIAGVLAVGQSCPVCGSCDHPSVAVPAPDAVDAAAEQQAQRALDDAQAVEHLRDVERRDLQHHLGVLLERAGSTAEADLVARLQALDAELVVARSEADGLSAHRADLAARTAERDSLAERLTTARAAVAATGSRRDTQATALQGARAELAAALAGTGQATATGLVADLEHRDHVVGVAVRSHDEVLGRRTAHQEALAALTDGLDGSGFDAAPDVDAAALRADEVADLQAEVTAHDRRAAAVQAVLADLGDADEPARSGTGVAAAAPEVVVADLGRRHHDALAAQGEARADAARLRAAQTRLADLVDRFGVALAVWEPLQHDLELATHVASFAEGKAADNRLQMRLSAYVLAHRLGQVVAAANERLSSMSDQRYALEHTARRGAGETRGGLSLLVRDDWSGESRDPATLSGGETFVVSLALALGLADVITQEAGGADLDTLFVDEGFGSLDADTLDDVMDVLDALRDGGRVVGVVSHVAEMRDRIPTRLLVAKSRSGSTLTQVP